MIRLLLLLLVSALAAGAAGVRAQPLLDWSPEEIRAVGRHGPWPPPPVQDPSNKVSGVPAGIALGVLTGNEADAQKIMAALDRTNSLLARLDGLALKADGNTNYSSVADVIRTFQAPGVMISKFKMITDLEASRM